MSAAKAAACCSTVDIPEAATTAAAEAALASDCSAVFNCTEVGVAAVEFDEEPFEEPVELVVVLTAAAAAAEDAA